jgi:hypothetical protein
MVHPIPRVQYDAGAGTVTIDFTHPSRPYTYESKGIGGSDVSASGIPESFQIRRDQLLHWVLIFLEAEWAAVETWLAWAQSSGGSFTFFPDKDQLGSSYVVYLHAPEMGDGIAPRRSVDYLGAFELELSFRRTTSVRFDSPILDP